MSGVLVLAEHVRGQLRDVTAEVVTAAAGSGLGPVTVVVIAREAESIAAACALAGVDEVVQIALETPGFDPDAVADAVVALAAERRPTAILASYAVDTMSVGAAIAVRLDAGFASDVTGIAVEDGALVATRELYQGKVAAELDFPDASTVVLLLRAGMWPPAATGGSPQRTTAPPPAARGRVRHLGYVEPPAPAGADIGAADVLVSIGRGIGEQEHIALFEQVAERLGAVLASSRPLVDAGWMPRERQVGQSGRTVAPSVYVAFGVSGAVQHLAGMRGSRTIIAVNTDAEAAIFGVAQYGATVDALDVAEAIVES